MSCYVNSNDNRFYTALESVFGTAVSVQAANRFPAVRLQARQQTERVKRRDKTGSRTFPGLPNQLRRITGWGVSTFLTAWTNQSAEPSYGPLFTAALGAAAKIFAGGTLASVTSGITLNFTNPHGLSVGQAVSLSGELRFVVALPNSSSAQINAPFTGTVGSGTVISPTITYS